jgi:hypothetical protein
MDVARHREGIVRSPAGAAAKATGNREQSRGRRGTQYNPANAKQDYGEIAHLDQSDIVKIH